MCLIKAAIKPCGLSATLLTSAQVDLGLHTFIFSSTDYANRDRSNNKLSIPIKHNKKIVILLELTNVTLHIERI